MKNYFILFAILCLMIASCGKHSETTDVEINPSIRKKVEKNISAMDFEAGEMFYKNRLFIDLYESDKLTVSTKGKDVKNPFKSFYYWNADTLHIDGAFGLFGGFGFTVKMVGNEAKLYHLLASDEHPVYANKKKDSLLYMLAVPCKDTKIVLSELPTATNRKTIYGYVEFKSDTYFESSGFSGNQEILPRQKLRADMKIYFKAGELSKEK